MTSPCILFVLIDSHLRVFGEAEAIATLSPEYLTLPRRFERIDLRPFQSDAEGGHWEPSHRYIRQRAADILAAEAATTMALLGVTSVADLRREHVSLRSARA